MAAIAACANPESYFLCLPCRRCSDAECLQSDHGQISKSVRLPISSWCRYLACVGATTRRRGEEAGIEDGTLPVRKLNYETYNLSMCKTDDDQGPLERRALSCRRRLSNACKTGAYVTDRNISKSAQPQPFSRCLASACDTLYPKGMRIHAHTFFVTCRLMESFVSVSSICAPRK